MPDAEVTRVCSATNILLKYNWHLDLTDNKAVVNLRLLSIKKYWRRAAQVVDKLSHLPDFLPALAMFVNEARGNYDQKIQLNKRLRFRRDRDHKWVFSYFVKLYTSVQCWKIDGKILRIHLSWLRSLYVILLCGVAQAAILDKIIYSWEKMNQIKEILEKVSWLKGCY